MSSRPQMSNSHRASESFHKGGHSIFKNSVNFPGFSDENFQISSQNLRSRFPWLFLLIQFQILWFFHYFQVFEDQPVSARSLPTSLCTLLIKNCECFRVRMWVLFKRACGLHPRGSGKRRQRTRLALASVVPSEGGRTWSGTGYVMETQDFNKTQVYLILFQNTISRLVLVLQSVTNYIGIH